MAKLHPFLAGTIGGMMPHLAASIRQALGSADVVGVPLYLDPGAWAGALVMGLVAGALVVYWHKEEDTKKAIALGIAAPGLVLSFFSASPAPTRPDPHQTEAGATRASAGWLVDVVQAEEPATLVTAAVAPTQVESVLVQVTVTGSVNVPGLDLVAVLPDGGAGPEALRHVAGAGTTVWLPAAATQLYALVAGVASDRVPMPRSGPNGVAVAVEIRGRSFAGGFVRAFGVRNPPVRVRIRAAAR